MLTYQSPYLLLHYPQQKSLTKQKELSMKAILIARVSTEEPVFAITAHPEPVEGRLAAAG